MKRPRTREIDRFDRFLPRLEKERVALIHHTDPDGVTSGVLLATAIQRLRRMPIELRHNQRANEVAITKATVDLLKRHKITTVFITDMAADEGPEAIREIERFAKVILIDHHPVAHDITSARTVMIKASRISSIPPREYCTAKLVYDLFSPHIDLSDKDWVAAIGIISDGASMRWLTFIREVFRRYKLRMPADIKKSALGKLSTMLSQAEAYDASAAKEAFQAVFRAKTYKDISSSEVAKIAKVVDREVERQLKDHKRWCAHDIDHDALIGEVRSRFAIKSHITGELSALYPHRAVICYQIVPGHKVSVSAWRKDGKQKMNVLLKRATRRLEGASAGGHDTMAGATIAEKDLEKFKQELYLALEAC